MTLRRSREDTGDALEVPAVMNAAVLDAVGEGAAFRSADVSVPVPVSSEILVRVRAASANPLDGSTVSGADAGEFIPSFPAVLGSDFSGTVVRTPYAAHPLRVGDDVFGVLSPRGSGSFAGYAAVPSLQLAKTPARLTLLEAAAVPLASLTAWGMLVEVGKTHEGQRVLILGASTGPGHLAVQLAQYFGARVIAVASTERAGWVRELGADQIISDSANLAEATHDIDLLIDMTGDASGLAASAAIPTLRHGGLLVTSSSEALPLLGDACRAAGVRATDYRPAPDGATLAVIARLIDSGDLAVHIDEVYPLARVEEAVGRVGTVRGKLVVEISDYRA